MRKSYFKASLLTLAISVVLFAGGGARAKDNSWGHITDSTVRFQVLSNFNNQAVLDRDTGLIWEQCPAVPANNELTIVPAVIGCYNRSTGGVKGWRLPTTEELMSLAVGNALPMGAPFCTYLPVANSSNNTFFWTSTQDPADPTKHIGVLTPDGGESVVSQIPTPIAAMPSVWCVRGGSNDSSGP
jgi:uncharacterized protein DUF1566